MKKINLLLLPLFLYGCTASQNSDSFYTDDEYLYDDEATYYGEDNTFYTEDNYYDGEEGWEVEQTNPVFTEDEYTVAIQEEISVADPQTTNTQPTFIQPAQPIQLEDGVVIEIPEQKVYIEAPAPQPVMQQVAVQPVIQQQPITPQPIVMPAVMITMQNVNYPNMYVQCLSTDTACLVNYQQQGYIRLQDKPQFAGYRDILSPTDYPGQGQWQYNHNIPRW